MNDDQDQATALILDDADPEAKQAAREDMSLEDLDAENEQRLARLMSGALGMKVNLQPGIFENIRETAYLEAIAEHLGVADGAKRAYAMNAAKVLDGFESTVRMAVIQQGGGQPLDLSAARSMQAQVGRNREERRAAARRVEPDGV